MDKPVEKAPQDRLGDFGSQKEMSKIREIYEDQREFREEALKSLYHQVESLERDQLVLALKASLKNLLTIFTICDVEYRVGDWPQALPKNKLVFELKRTTGINELFSEDCDTRDQ